MITKERNNEAVLFDTGLGHNLVKDLLKDFKITKVFLSHWHEDHLSGLERLIRKFGTNFLFYPKTVKSGSMALMTDFADKEAKRVSNNYMMSHQSIDTSKIIDDDNFFGDVKIEILWPRRDFLDKKNENNNSIVLKMTLDNVHFILTGDADEKVWNNISRDLPSDTKFFKVPHHGSKNGTFVDHHTPWLDRLNRLVSLGISGHVGKYVLPRPEVINEFENRNLDYYRTDHHYHLTFTTYGNNRKKVDVKYSRIKKRGS